MDVGRSIQHPLGWQFPCAIQPVVSQAFVQGPGLQRWSVIRILTADSEAGASESWRVFRWHVER